MVKLHSSLFRKSLIILGFFLTALFGYGHFIDGDVIQILDKAHLLVSQGIFTPFGNVSSSGASGNTPGGFLTLVTGGPMLLWFSPWAALILLALLHFGSFLLIQNVFKNFVSPIGLTCVVVLFWLNPWRLSEVFLWNPAYIFISSALHMWSAYHLSKEKSFSFSVIHGLSLFLGLQIHPSFIILFFMTMMLLWMKALKPHLLGTLTGIILGLLSLVPYFLAGLEDPSIFPQPGSGDGKGFLFFGLVYVYPLLKGFWYWILFGSTIFQTHVFHQVEFSWLGAEGAEWLVRSIWTVVKYIVGAVGVGLSFYVNYHFMKSRKIQFNVFKYKMTSPQQWLGLYAIVAFWAALIATAISPTLPIYWHLLYIWPMALIPLVLALDRFLVSGARQKRARGYLVLLIVYFTMTNILAGVESKKHDISKPFHNLYFKACQERCTMQNLKSAEENQGAAL